MPLHKRLEFLYRLLALACPEDVDHRRLDRVLFWALLAGKSITDRRNLIPTGTCGVSNAWLGCALVHAAYREGITKTELMIFDDWGPDSLTAAERRDLMDTVEVRYGRAVPPLSQTGCRSQTGMTLS